MKIAHIETHLYAPELNKAVLRNGITFDCPGVTSVAELRKTYFKPMKKGKYATITYTNTKNPELNRTYSGLCGNGYKSIQAMMVALKKRHNMGGCFKIKIKTV